MEPILPKPNRLHILMKHLNPLTQKRQLYQLQQTQLHKITTQNIQIHRPSLHINKSATDPILGI